tara:strand:- start:554 stop:1249 length:696 start_codon:yes stop_codon:yes gene_type:complete
MAYIPLNKIVTDLSTDGTEYELLNGTSYKGKYWKNYKGEFFTGKTPNDSPTVRLYLKTANDNDGKDLPLPFTQNAALYNEIFEDYEGPYTISEDLPLYNEIKKIDIEVIKNNPYTYYPQPTGTQYLLGVFDRFFCFKHNNLKFIEINPKVYNALFGKDGSWNWEEYTTFKIPWTISTNALIADVERTNRNQVLLAEKKIKRKGLGRYLKFQWSKFYLSQGDLEQIKKLAES